MWAVPVAVLWRNSGTCANRCCLRVRQRRSRLTSPQTNHCRYYNSCSLYHFHRRQPSKSVLVDTAVSCYDHRRPLLFSYSTLALCIVVRDRVKPGSTGLELFSMPRQLSTLSHSTSSLAIVQANNAQIGVLWEKCGT